MLYRAPVDPAFEPRMTAARMNAPTRMPRDADARTRNHAPTGLPQKPIQKDALVDTTAARAAQNIGKDRKNTEKYKKHRKIQENQFFFWFCMFKFMINWLLVNC